MDKHNMRVVTLKDLWQIFVRHFAVMALAAVTCCVACTGLSLSEGPRYASTATLYILRQNEGASSDEASSDFSLALKVVSDCSYLLRNHAVVDEVIRNLQLDMTYEQLYSRISTSNPDNTRVLEVTVEAETPELAKEIVDMLCCVGARKINQTMGYEQVNLFELGTLNTSPCNTVGMTVLVLIGTGAAVLVYGVFLVMFLLDDRLRTGKDIEHFLSRTVLGELPEGEAREDYKILRTNVQFCGQDNRVIAMTGCAGGEGKTTVTLGLAGSLAELGKRVLVIDADMRGSTIAARYAPEKNSGLSQVLTGYCTMGEAVYVDWERDIHILFAGQYPPNPVELLNGEYFSLLMQEARREYDYILVDTPPMGRLIDAAVAATLCDGVILVVDGDKTRQCQARDALAQLEKSGSKILGVVRNRVKPMQ